MVGSNRTARGGAAVGVAALALALACGGCGHKEGLLELSATSLSFAAEQNGTPDTKTVTATFVGDALTVGYLTGADMPSWLSVKTESSGGGTEVLSLTASAEWVTRGTYHTVLRFVARRQDGGPIASRDLSIDFVVSAGLQAPTSTIAFSSSDGVAAPPRMLTLSSDRLPQAWALAVEPDGYGATDWVVLAATSGTITGTSTRATTQVEIGAAARPSGSYSATLVVRDGAGRSRARVPLTYSVTTEFTTEFTVAGALSAHVSGAATAAPVDLPLSLHTKLGAATGAGRRWIATTTEDWISVVPASGDLSADATLVVRLDPTKVWALIHAKGTYGATVTIATEDGRTTVTVPVSLTLE